MPFTARPATAGTEAVRAARDFLFAHATDYEGARAGFAWPELSEFNFALEWFDVVAGEHPDRPAVTIVSADLGTRSWSYAELSRRSSQVANWLAGLGVRRGSHVIVMLGNTIELWEVMLGIAKLGAVSIPTSTLLSASDLAFRVEQGEVDAIITLTDLAERIADLPDSLLRIGVGSDTSDRTSPDAGDGTDPDVGDGTDPNAGDSVGLEAGARVDTDADTDAGPSPLPAGWHDYRASGTADDRFEPDAPTPATDTSLLYFTSGTTSRPKLVEHTHVSYPIGHLSTMWWLGVRPGDVHLNISSPGWAKHAWSSFYSPFLADATVFVFNYDRFDANVLMDVMEHHQVSSICAPPTVWRMLIQADLGRLSHPPRELVGAGEPLNPEVINRVRDAWGGTIRDGFGQTEMTCCVGNSPGQIVHEGSMGRPLPGYPVVLVDPTTGERIDDPDAGAQVAHGAGDPDGGANHAGANHAGASTPAARVEGEICLDLGADTGAGDRAVLGLMKGYYGDPETTARSRAGGFHHTGDIATRDEHGYLTYVGRADDVFKASDYKISPFELESVLLEHPDVTEAAVVPSPDPVRLAVPKAYLRVTERALADPADAVRSIFAHARERLSPYQWVRVIEFVPELPKTISGKIRRVDLRAAEAERVAARDDARQHWERDYR
jgi:acetyl-CoA synthetase